MSEDTADSSGPRDAAVMEAILKEMGVEDYDPNVIQQMLEFSYRYVTNILEDARVYSEHAQKKELDVSDVKLAVQTRVDHSFTAPPPRDFLIEVARKKNSTPLPLIPEKFGPRLPPERYCLTANNYKLKERQKTSSLQKPQVTLAATFRLPLSTKQQSTTSSATSALRTQLTSPLHQATSAGAMSSSSMPSVSVGNSTSGDGGLSGHFDLGSGLQSPSAVSGHSMPTLTPMGSERSLGQLSGNTNANNSKKNSTLTSLIMNTPRINKLD